MSRELFVATIGRARRDRSFMLNLSPIGEELELTFSFWILRDAHSTILIETGFPEAVGAARGIYDYADPTDVLARIGVTPGEIKTIVVSHLHWDHFAGPERFPNATFIIQHDEIEYFTGPGRNEPAGKIADKPSIDALDEIRAQDRLHVVDGDVRIFDDLSLVRVGGHTPGLQIAVLQTEQGPRVFACDAAHLYANVETRTPTSIIYSYRDYQRGFAKIAELSAGGRWYPGHDPKLLEGLETVAERIYRLR